MILRLRIRLSYCQGNPLVSRMTVMVAHHIHDTAHRQCHHRMLIATLISGQRSLYAQPAGSL